MTTFIENPIYSTLASYAVLGHSRVTFAPGLQGTALTDGFYGSNPTPTVEGTVNSVVVTAGNNVAQDGSARIQADALFRQLQGVQIGPTVLSIGTGPNYTFEPGRYDSASSIIFPAGSSITFTNTANILNPQWLFYSASTITFTDVRSFTYHPSAEGKSIYWAAGTSITVDSLTVLGLRGVFIAKASITFSGTSNPNPGAAYSGSDGNTGAVTFSGIGTMRGLGFPIVFPICFPANTPVNTDQGITSINKIVAGIHTINNKRIIAVTKTVDENTFLVCFKKNSLGDNIPNQDTITSKYHGVEYNGQMYEAHQLLESVENVIKLEYTGEVMYNILMDEHEKIVVNNMICETLHPDHPFAMKYNNFSEERVSNVEVLCA